MAIKHMKAKALLFALTTCAVFVASTFHYKKYNYIRRLHDEVPNHGIVLLGYMPWPFGDKLVGKVSADSAIYLATMETGAPVKTKTLRLIVHCSDGTVFIEDL